MDASIATSLWKEGKDASAENSYWMQVQFYFTTLSFTLQLLYLKNILKSNRKSLFFTALDYMWSHTG